MKNPYLLIGEIVRPQGLRGEVKVRHFSSDPHRFKDLRTVWIRKADGYETLDVIACRVQKEDVYLFLDSVASRDAAEKFRGVKLFVDRAHARKLPPGEVFIADILGVVVRDTQGNEVGTLKEVLTPGGADVFVLDTPRGCMMFPALKTVVLTLDAENGKIVVDGEKLGEVALYENSDSDPVSPNV